MGKHSKKKSKKHHKEKKSKHKKRRHSSTDSSSEEEWVEKVQDSSSDEEKLIEKKRRKEKIDSSSSENSEQDKPSTSRDEWMNLSTSFLSTSHVDKRKAREEEKKQEREQQKYNPRECARELNPYWKDGGDGLPKFKKPSEDETGNKQQVYKRSGSSRASFTNTRPSWKKKKDENQHVNSEESKFPAQNTQSTSKELEGTVFTEKELNQLAAKLVKAEIMGNTKLVDELKSKLERARENIRKPEESGEDVVLTHTDSQGHSVPLKYQSEYDHPSNHKRKKNIETHKDGQRVRYFPDDDKYSLNQMFENEKFNTVEDQNSEFLKMASKISKKDDLDDIFSDNIRKKQSDAKIDEKQKSRAISEHQRMSKSLDNCKRCIQSESMAKHLMVSMAETVYISLPPFEPLTEGHCFIVPVRHVPCATQLDENEWHEISDIRKALIKLFASQDRDVIFFESAMYLHKFPHMHIECIPLPKEDGDMAPIYFKKAIDESETEWAQNKKLVSLKGRDVRRAIPKGLPYFFVSFGMEEGYAHVIEDEKMFPLNFAQEIIGGMLDLHHSKWRKPKRQDFDEQNKRVLVFSKEWTNFDCTIK